MAQRATWQKLALVLGLAQLLVGCNQRASDPLRGGGALNLTVATSEPFNEDDIVYMVLTDRFNDGDPSNNNQGFNEYRPGNLKFYQGGDWQGLINQFNYIRDLGVTAIWISPVSDDQDVSKDGGEAGYHGYFTLVPRGQLHRVWRPNG